MATNRADPNQKTSNPSHNLTSGRGEAQAGDPLRHGQRDAAPDEAAQAVAEQHDLALARPPRAVAAPLVVRLGQRQRAADGLDGEGDKRVEVGVAGWEGAAAVARQVEDDNAGWF